MTSKFEPKSTNRKVAYQTPRLAPVGKVAELTSGPITVTAEGSGMGFKS
jgi:hypothetical protein